MNFYSHHLFCNLLCGYRFVRLTASCLSGLIGCLRLPLLVPKRVYPIRLVVSRLSADPYAIANLFAMTTDMPLKIMDVVVKLTFQLQVCAFYGQILNTNIKSTNQQSQMKFSITVGFKRLYLYNTVFFFSLNITSQTKQTVVWHAKILITKFALALAHNKLSPKNHPTLRLGLESELALVLP